MSNIQTQSRQQEARKDQKLAHMSKTSDMQPPFLVLFFLEMYVTKKNMIYVWHAPHDYRHQGKGLKGSG